MRPTVELPDDDRRAGPTARGDPEGHLRLIRSGGFYVEHWIPLLVVATGRPLAGLKDSGSLLNRISRYPATAEGQTRFDHRHQRLRDHGRGEEPPRFIAAAIAATTVRDAISDVDRRRYGEVFQDPARARAATRSYRSFLLQELPQLGRYRSSIARGSFSEPKLRASGGGGRRGGPAAQRA